MTDDLVSRLRQCATAWAMEQTLKGRPTRPEASYDWAAADALDAKDAEIERLGRELATYKRQDFSGWIELQEEYDRMVLALIAECEAYRNGCGVSHPAGVDPVKYLKWVTPRRDSDPGPITAERDRLSASNTALREALERATTALENCRYSEQPLARELRKLLLAEAK